jgi:hypothetical protein
MFNNKIKVELTEEQAELFVFLQKNYNNIKKLADSQVFTFTTKKATIHLDNKGEINGVDVVIRLI